MRYRALPPDYCVFLGRNSGREVVLSNPGVIDLSLDWVIVSIVGGAISLLVPCEVQSIDTTGNYRKNWHAYAHREASVPNSKHGMNWANVRKRLIPQLVLKSAVAATSKLCTKGTYFIVPDRVYVQFEKIVGFVAALRTEDGGGVDDLHGSSPTVPAGWGRWETNQMDLTGGPGGSRTRVQEAYGLECLWPCPRFVSYPETPTDGLAQGRRDFWFSSPSPVTDSGAYLTSFDESGHRQRGGSPTRLSATTLRQRRGRRERHCRSHLDSSRVFTLCETSTATTLALSSPCRNLYEPV